MAQKIFLNDKIIDSEKACISVNDSGFLYGAGLFETMRSHNSVVFSLDDHLERLFSSAKTLGINHSYSKKQISQAIYQTLQANNLKDARLRLTLTGGSISVSQENPRPTLLITATQFQPYPAQYYEKGVLVILCPYQQNQNEPIAAHKTTNYFSRMIALRLAHERKAAEALWFTTDNRLAEGCVSNVFLVKDSTIYTPPLYTPVLPGIARKTVCKLAVKNSIELIEKDLVIDDVLAADEIFLTNVIMQVMPVVQVEKHTVGQGKVGQITKSTLEKFNELLENQCIKNDN